MDLLQKGNQEYYWLGQRLFHPVHLPTVVIADNCLDLFPCFTTMKVEFSPLSCDSKYSVIITIQNNYSPLLSATKEI